MATPTASKRKRVVLTLEKKLAILDRLSKGETQAAIAHEYGIGKATVYDLKKNENKIKLYARKAWNIKPTLLCAHSVVFNYSTHHRSDDYT